MSFLPAVRPAALAERFRQSLFVIPVICLVLGAAVGQVVVRLDRAGAADHLPDSFATTGENARAVLTAIATGTITVVTLVLTLTLVAIQLAAGQLSPRTIVNFLADRVQQATVGIVLGTATLSLFALRALPPASDDAGPLNVTALTAVAATVASLVMLVLSVDRTASRLAVGNLLRDIAEETCHLVERRYKNDGRRLAGEGPSQIVAAPAPARSSRSGRAVTTPSSGWIQYIDEESLLETLPEGAGVTLLHPVGTFVLAGMELARLDDPSLDDEVERGVRGAIIVGEQRTMQQDVSYGLTRLTDIGLRALSPGINDSNTAREVVVRTAQVVMALQAHELDAVEVDIEGHHVVRHGAPTHDGFVRDAFDQLRHSAADDVATLRTLVRTLGLLGDETDRRGLPGSCEEIHRQRDLAARRLREIDDTETRADLEQPYSIP
jgi:uncharacterized membrane protein